MKKMIRVIRKNKKEQGVATLEYTALAAMVIVGVYVAFQALGGNIGGMANAIGSWSTKRANAIRGVN